jgi:hypothetical protein
MGMFHDMCILGGRPGRSFSAHLSSPTFFARDHGKEGCITEQARRNFETSSQSGGGVLKSGGI